MSGRRTPLKYQITLLQYWGIKSLMEREPEVKSVNDFFAKKGLNRSTWQYRIGETHFGALLSKVDINPEDTQSTERIGELSHSFEPHPARRKWFDELAPFLHDPETGQAFAEGKALLVAAERIMGVRPSDPVAVVAFPFRPSLARMLAEAIRPRPPRRRTEFSSLSAQVRPSWPIAIDPAIESDRDKLEQLLETLKTLPLPCSIQWRNLCEAEIRLRLFQHGTTTAAALVPAARAAHDALLLRCHGRKATARPLLREVLAYNALADTLFYALERHDWSVAVQRMATFMRFNAEDGEEPQSLRDKRNVMNLALRTKLQATQSYRCREDPAVAWKWRHLIRGLRILGSLAWINLPLDKLEHDEALARYHESDAFLVEVVKRIFPSFMTVEQR